MKIGLIAGNGQFPIIFSKKAKNKGIKVYAVAYNNETDPEIEDYVEKIIWIHVGQIKRLLSFLKKHTISEAVMLGGIKKTRIFSDIKPDLKAISIFRRIKNTHDDNILKTFANVLEDEGIKIKSSIFLLPELLAKEGCWTKRKPTKDEFSDINFGWHIAKEIGRLDIGQCIVAGKGSILAVEAIDGTDSTITRGGELGQGNAVAIKIIKPNQDTRFDIPAIGKQTIQTMYESKVKVLAIEAEKTIVFDKEEMIKKANDYKISIIALKDKNEKKIK